MPCSPEQAYDAYPDRELILKLSPPLNQVKLGFHHSYEVKHGFHPVPARPEHTDRHARRILTF